MARIGEVKIVLTDGVGVPHRTVARARARGLLMDELQPDMAPGPRKRIVSMFDDDTAEARMVRAEVAARAAMQRCWDLEAALSAVDQALTDERVPLYGSGARDLTRLTRYGRIRWLGDQRRVALRNALDQPNRYGLPPGQMSVDDCIAEAERDAR